jgi:DNA-directed RNA polymerase subunit E'/Rpb7
MDSEKITLRINPIQLNSGLMNHIHETIRKIKIGTCRSQGYIIDITKIKVTDITISKANGDTLAFVVADEILWKPTIGEILDGEVCRIHKQGITVVGRNSLNIFVTKTNLEENGFVFNEKDSEYNNSKMCIKSKSNISVEIDQIKYSNSKFCCIGKLYLKN